MAEVLRLSMVQMTSHDTHAPNVAALRDAVARAAGDGAQMLALPEAAGLMNRDRDKARAQITEEAEDPYVSACREEAARLGIWIHSGSCPVRIDPAGAIVARYDKIHLFDVFLDGRQPTGESARYAPGREAVVVDTPFGPLGLSICYDLRFPHLYRDYALGGATVLFVPSAFTVPTGRAHWEPLLRARAIENGAYVVAAAQVGLHADGRVTWGHSVVVSPWGEVLADLGGEVPGQITLDLPLEMVEAARRQIPSLQNGRDYTLQRITPAAAEIEPEHRKSREAVT